jgi:predicted transcriptional regulator
VTETELAILQYLWDAGPSTIRQVADILYPRGGRAQYATVQKLLDRLEQDGWVARTKAQPANIYRANVGREELIGRRLQAVAETLCGGSLTPLLTHLVRANRLSDAELRELRGLIDEEGRR